MKAEPSQLCKSLTKDGKPCGGTPRASGYCWSHDPELDESRKAGSAKGGRSRSNAARAWRQFEAVDQEATLADLGPILFRALRMVAGGELHPSVTNSMAALARAIADVSFKGDLVERMEVLEQAIAKSEGVQLRSVK